jgi:hypothetical protein
MCYPDNMPASSNKLEFITSYNQFYIADKNYKGNTGANFWNKEAYFANMAIDNGIIGINTESYGYIKGELEIFDSKPRNLDINKYDHIVEGGLTISSGEIQVLNCPDSNVELRASVHPGSYRVRVYFLGLIGLKSDDYDEELRDFYRIQIWPDSNMKREVLKQY